VEECISHFLAKFNPQKHPLYCMALAVAGPVENNAVKITNLVR
jgi:glucokinase